MSFDDFGLDAVILNNIAQSEYRVATPVQQQTIPLVLAQKDVLVRAQTGTGKTAAFALPLMQLLAHHHTNDRRHPRALVITPTRELAQQVLQSFQSYGKGMPLKYAAVYGGVGTSAQVDSLNRGVDILVATPGRLLDLHGQSRVRLDNVEVLVLDEADRMLDMGFIDDIRRIVESVPKKRQSLLFSATYARSVMGLAGSILYRPERVDVAPRNDTVESVRQVVYRMEASAKRGVLRHLIQQGGWTKVLVFTRTKFATNRLAEYLNKYGIGAAVLHGNKSQAARDKALDAFKQGDAAVLVATDVAARGLDISDISHVVNFELPQVPEDYIHRVGRTGRAGNSGDAISLVAPEEKAQLKQIERVMHRHIPLGELKGEKGETISPNTFCDDGSSGGEKGAGRHRFHPARYPKRGHRNPRAKRKSRHT